jgi:hypothetical protein
VGLYINPPDMEKEAFLNKYGSPCLPELPTDSNLALVCLVHNETFTAAGVVIDERDLVSYNTPEDARFKLWFTVPKKELIKVTNRILLNHYMPESREWTKEPMKGV